jgi:hypothetical protein
MRGSRMPIVLRIAEETFAASIARHFELETTFSVAALAAPVFAGLARVAGSRGRIDFAGQEFAVAELAIGEGAPLQLPPGAIPLAAGTEQGDFRLTRDFAGLAPGTRVLVLAALAKMRADPEPFFKIAEANAAAERLAAQPAGSHRVGA